MSGVLSDSANQGGVSISLQTFTYLQHLDVEAGILASILEVMALTRKQMGFIQTNS
jgi:hypothetical protein